MSYTLERLIDSFAQRDVRRATGDSGAAARAVVIRPAREQDAAALAELAALDTAPPLIGPALVAVVEDRVWAAHGLEDDRVIADPFFPSAEAAGLLRLRVRQLRVSGNRAQPRLALRRRLARRVGAS